MSSPLIEHVTMRKYLWTVILVLGVPFLLIVIGSYFFGFIPDGGKTDIAAQQCQSLSKMCEAYRLKPQNNNHWPERLEDLVVAKPGEEWPVLDGGLNAIRDPWGKPYRYARFDSPEGTSIYIWTEYENDQELHFIGVRRSPDGHFMKFARVKD